MTALPGKRIVSIRIRDSTKQDGRTFTLLVTSPCHTYLCSLLDLDYYVFRVFVAS